MKAVFKISWESAKANILAANKEFYALLEPIVKELRGETSDFFYKMCYHFGDDVISNGKMTLINSEYELNILSEETNNVVQSKDQLKREFFEAIDGIKGHPLSLVIKNYIEIFRTQHSTYSLGNTTERKLYIYPLNLITEGQFFGIWESINMIFDDQEPKDQGWDAVAGKKCIFTTLPLPEASTANRKYRDQHFGNVFGKKSENYVDGFNHIANSLLKSSGQQFFTEIILIPKHYYTFEPVDNKQMIALKSKLREFIFKAGWSQAEIRRSTQFDDLALIERFKIYEKDTSFALPLLKHLKGIVNSSNFIIKPISYHDGFLFEVVLEIIRLFSIEKYTSYSPKTEKDLTLLEYNTPLFFHYDKLDRNLNWGFEMIHSPSIDTTLPLIKIDDLKRMINHVKKHEKLAKYMSDDKFKIKIAFYVSNSDHSIVEGETVQDFILLGPIAKIIKDHIPENSELRAPSKYPWFFNVLIYIEKL